MQPADTRTTVCKLLQAKYPETFFTERVVVVWSNLENGVIKFSSLTLSFLLMTITIKINSPNFSHKFEQSKHTVLLFFIFYCYFMKIHDDSIWSLWV